MVLGLNNDDGLRVVDLDTNFFTAEAVFIGDMPSEDVTKLYVSQRDSDRLLRLQRLISRALLDPNKALEMSRLSFDQFAVVINTYAVAKPRKLDWNKLERQLLG